MGRWLRALGDAGLPGVVLREPHLSPQALQALLAVAEAAVPWVAVHDRHPEARRVGRPLHLASTAQAAPPGIPWGRSCHSREEVDAALAQGATWVWWSPVWRPTSKPGDRRAPIGEAAFVAHAAGRPVLALGGVTPARFLRLRQQGAYGAAVLGDLFGQASAAIAATRLRAYALRRGGA